MNKTDERYTYVKQCADCGSRKILVKNCRERSDGVFWRDKYCADCGYEFRTVEMEECVSDIDSLLQDNEALRKENEALKERIRLIKARVRDM